jgi:hypothetical protein
LGTNGELNDCSETSDDTESCPELILNSSDDATFL